MAYRYVIDTVGFINYFNEFFDESDKLSKQARKIIDNCFDPYMNYYTLIIPSVVFIEIFKKFLRTEEIAQKFYYNVFFKVKSSDDIEVKPIEREVLQVFSKIGNDVSLELHDKIIFSSAIQLESPLISIDSKIIAANKRLKVIPEIIF